MKDEKVIDAPTKTHGSSAMSDFFRHGSVEERRAVYAAVASAAICEQKDVIRSVKADDMSVEKVSDRTVIDL